MMNREKTVLEGVNMLIILVLILSVNIEKCRTEYMIELAKPMVQFNEACGYDACPIPMSTDGINVHLVPHTHYEVGLDRTFAEHYTGEQKIWAKTEVNMKRTLDMVITELWAKQYRRFALSNVEYFFHWWSQRDTTVREMVYALIRQGRLVFIGGGWSMNDEATTSYHAIIDSYTYSLRKLNATFLHCGRPLVAWQADVIGHSREFASLAAQMGYDALFISPISFDDELARMRRWALEMLWRGSDDLGPKSDIYTHKLFDGYWVPPGFCFSTLCDDPLIISSDFVLSNVEERAKQFIDSIYNRQSPNYNSSHVMVVMGQVNGYWDANMWFGNIDALINAVNERGYKGKRKLYLMYSTPACYAKAVHDAEMPLETKQDDFFPVAYDRNSYLVGFFTSCPSIKLMAREIMIYLQMCKQMEVFAELGNYYSKLYEELNWVMSVFQDHTVTTGASKDHVKSYYVKKMYVAVQRATTLLKEAWNKLRKSPPDTIYYRCSFNASRCHQLYGSSYFVQIYNPLAWRVSIPVRFPVKFWGEEFNVYDHTGKSVKAAVMKIPYPVLSIPSRVNSSDVEVVFMAENLPPIGYRSYFIERVRPQSLINKVVKTDKEDKAGRFLKRDTENVKPETDTGETLKNKDTENLKSDTGTGEIEKNNANNNVTNNPKNSVRRAFHKTREKMSRTLIKHLKKKSNKKYLIRQITPLADDQELMYDLDSKDYDDDNTTESTPSKNNSVSVLLENDFDEIKMQQLSDSDNEATTKPYKEVPFLRPVENRKPQMTKHPNNVDKATLTIDDDTAPQHWKEIAMQDLKTNRRMNEVNEIVRNMITRTTTLKYDVTRTPEMIRMETLKRAEEEPTAVKEGTGDIPKSLLGFMRTEDDSRRTEANAEGSMNETVKDVTREVMDTVPFTTEFSVEDTQMPTFTTTAPNETPDSASTQTEETPIEISQKEYNELWENEIKRKMFEMRKTNQSFIENKYIRINMDPVSNKVTTVSLLNGVHMDLDIQFYYYVSDDPEALGKKEKKPGAYLFRAVENKPIPILDKVDTQIYKSSIVQEAHIVYSDWTSFVLRVYAESPVIEVEWLIGPIPVEDKLGKEVFVRYLTNIVHEGVFYTDSNGRQTIKRIRNLRPMFEQLNMDQVAGNFYPVTSKISIEDLTANVRFSVFTDRAQGGASLSDGELDLMLSRRILTDDTGLETFVNDTEFGQGVVVRGKHYLYISKVNYKPYRIFEKKFAKEVSLAPQILVSRPDPHGEDSIEVWQKSVNEMSFLKNKLPIGVHLLTIEHWNYNTLLIRLENFLEKTDTQRKPIKTVFLRDLFTNIYINKVRETTLAANIWLSDYKKTEWIKKENFVKSFNDFYGVDKDVEFLKNESTVRYEEVDLDKGITLAPQQIRTFVCWFDYLAV